MSEDDQRSTDSAEVSAELIPESNSGSELTRQDERPFFIVGISASAGGLEAFTQLLQSLPADTGMTFVLIQHLAPSTPSALAEILSRSTTMSVTEVQDEPVVEPNCVYVIPPARSMIIEGKSLKLRPRESRGAPHPIDQFFRALAEERRDRAIGIVLSGTATDGTLGLEAIKSEGGITFAQDASAKHEGMPHSAIGSGCVDYVLSPEAIARELVRIASHPYSQFQGETREPDDRPKIAQILRILERVTGVDFTAYKFNTLYRRITRRMVLQKLETLPEYTRLLQDTPSEVDALYKDILINVTSFFRDPPAYDALKAGVFPRLVENRSHLDPIRFWVLGCSTGQEAYSLAIAFSEFSESVGSRVPLQVFATDLNAAGIDIARAGHYPKDIAIDVSPERLRRYFAQVDGHYRVSKEIRDVCVFSRHNVLADPPFSRMDLISCRNLLIYMDSSLQQTVMTSLHYALKPLGFLWLGNSETIGVHRNLFEQFDGKQKIFAKKIGSVPQRVQFSLSSGRSSLATLPAKFAPPLIDLQKEADRILVSKYAPPAVLVTSDLDILQYRGDTGPYLAPSPGKASLNLLKMLREGLLVPVRAAVVRAGKEKSSVREEGLRVKSNDGFRQVSIEVISITGNTKNEAGFLILFEEHRDGTYAVDAHQPVKNPDPATSSSTEMDASEAARLRLELNATREYLQAVIEQQEAANEELQSASEEVQSSNEELQSINEELETSKEEIQSSNEELVTVNDELNNRNMELNRLNNDLVNLFSSVQMAIIMVGPDLRVRRFTPIAEKILNLIPSDVGRPFADIKLNLQDIPDLEPLLVEVLDTVTVKELEARDKKGKWYVLRLRPYRTLDNRIDGVVIMLIDIDATKRAEEYVASIVATLREPLLVLDRELRIMTANQAYCEMFATTRKETENRFLYEIGDHQWDIPELRLRLLKILPRDEQFEQFRVEQDVKSHEKRILMLHARRLLQVDGRTPAILLGIEDFNDR